MSVLENFDKIKATIPSGVQLIAVSKTYSPEMVAEVYNTSHRVFGESRPQELVQKYQQLPKDIEWHFIGHLQTNKIKYIIPFVHLIHSTDSVRLFNEIEKEAKKNRRIVNCLLQVHIAEEETKFGFTSEELKGFLSSDEFKAAQHIRICGLMGMATYTDNIGQIHHEFRKLKNIFTSVKSAFFSDKPEFKELSMGMSGDYLIAIEEGATMVRVGSSIFGERMPISKKD
ncbi:MAG: YggS family pyridoxal phosphate-dependent enzyme [Prevotellaceae bacterium]|nr:YggS family pyridoxal phosphate-dependent enzyme [Prevotellaceae bacterium]